MSLLRWKNKIITVITNRENYSRGVIYSLIFFGSYIITLVVLGIIRIMSPSMIYISCYVGVFVGTAFGGVIGIVIMIQIAPDFLLNTGVPNFISNFVHIIVSLFFGIIFGIILGFLCGVIVGAIMLAILGVPFLILELGLGFYAILLLIDPLSSNYSV